MKARKMVLVLVALVFAITGNAQIVVNNEGNICAGNDSCFWGFDGAMVNQYMSPRWTNVNSTTFNVGGALSIAAMEQSQFCIRILQILSVGTLR